MSAFLGPVHHWMYNKIQVQEYLTDQVLALAEQRGWTQVSAEKFARANEAEVDQPLEDIIDTSNIHGWLSQRTQAAEDRFAAAIQEVLAEKRDERLSELTAFFEKLGHERAVPAGSDIVSAYQTLDGVLLDGMPCDGGRWVVSQEPDEIMWEYDPATHVLCRAPEGAAAYAALREAFLRGMFAHSGLAMNALGETTYRLAKGA